MAKKKKTQVDMLEEGAIMITQELSDDDFDDIESLHRFGEVGRHAQTFMLPAEDFAYSALLNAEKKGETTILSKQYCPCPKEGYILVLCEYDVNF